MRKLNKQQHSVCVVKKNAEIPNGILSRIKYTKKFFLYTDIIILNTLQNSYFMKVTGEEKKKDQEKNVYGAFIMCVTYKHSHGKSMCKHRVSIPLKTVILM